MSSLINIKVKDASHSSSWKDVLPANSPSVTSFNPLSSRIKNSSDLSHRGKKLVLSDKESSQFQNHEVIDLTGFSVMNEQANKKLLVGCGEKKRKLLSTEHAPAETMRISTGPSGAKPSEPSNISFKICSVKSEASPSDSRGMQNDAVGPALLHVHGSSHTTKKMGVESINQNDKIIKCNPAHLGDEEAKGSDFLSQVKCNNRTFIFVP